MTTALSPTDFGSLNEHAVGIVLKELVRRAIVVIRNERLAFEVQSKAAYQPGKTDLVTSADKKAQAVYIKSLRECFPQFGIIAEEQDLSIPPEHGQVYFTVDPLDGTKAYVRNQSHGVGTMVAMVKNEQVVTAYVGDINTHEIYGFRPKSDSVHRITEFESAQPLGHKAQPLSGQYLLLRDPLSKYSQASEKVSAAFKSYEIEGGSIGVWLARLWKREVGAAILTNGVETPWDTAPVIGISQRLGYAFYRPSDNGWEKYQPVLAKSTLIREHDMLIVHKNDAHQLNL